MKCPSCGVELSRSEAQAGCPLCDWTPQRGQAKPPVSDVWERILTDPVYGFATRLARHLIEQYDGEVSWKAEPVVWRNRRGSSHSKDRDGKHWLTFGYQSVRASHDEGMLEYKTWRWIWDGGLKAGREGVYQEVVHEFAHALQCERNGRHYGSAHTMVWAEAVREIQTLVPFGDVKDL